MAEDPDKVSVSLDVFTGDAAAIQAALEEEGIEVRDLSEQPTSGIAPLILWLIKVVIDGTAWDLSKFVATRGAKGLKRLVEHLQKKAGKPAGKGAVSLRDNTGTTVNLESDLPEAAYKALTQLKWDEVAGKNLRWHEPPGVWKEDAAPKITSGDAPL